MRKILIALTITVLISCTKDCFHSGATLEEKHTLIGNKHFIDTLKSKGITTDCDLVIIGVSEESWDTLVNTQDTLIYIYKYVRFREKL